jgi:DNA transposition AAA+ family ATPase
MDVEEQFRTLFREALTESGMTQAEFCRKVGVSQKHLSRVLSGKQGTTLAMWGYWGYVLGKRWQVKVVPKDSGG